MVGNNDEILDVKFLGADESHLAVASNSDQLRVFELSTLNCQILTGHTGKLSVLYFQIIDVREEGVGRVWVD